MIVCRTLSCSEWHGRFVTRFARIDSRESFATRDPYFNSASGRFARITRISDSRESGDSRESCESIPNRANHATKFVLVVMVLHNYCVKCCKWGIAFVKLCAEERLSHHFGGVLTSLKIYRATWGISAILQQYRAIWGH